MTIKQALAGCSTVFLLYLMFFVLSFAYVDSPTNILNVMWYALWNMLAVAGFGVLIIACGLSFMYFLGLFK